MKRSDFYEPAYLLPSLGGGSHAIPGDPVTLGNLDVFEDDSMNINRLFCATPLLSSNSLRLFFL